MRRELFSNVQRFSASVCKLLKSGGPGRTRICDLYRVKVAEAL